MSLNLPDSGISIGIEIITFPGISISIEIDQRQEKSQYRNWYRKSWYRRLLVWGVKEYWPGGKMLAYEVKKLIL